MAEDTNSDNILRDLAQPASHEEQERAIDRFHVIIADLRIETPEGLKYPKNFFDTLIRLEEYIKNQRFTPPPAQYDKYIAFRDTLEQELHLEKGSIITFSDLLPYGRGIMITDFQRPIVEANGSTSQGGQILLESLTFSDPPNKSQPLVIDFPAIISVLTRGNSTDGFIHAVQLSNRAGHPIEGEPATRYILIGTRPTLTGSPWDKF